MVEVKKVEYMGWENCYKISNGKIEAVVTTDVGPRIIHFGFEGGKNVFCVVEDQAGKLVAMSGEYMVEQDCGTVPKLCHALIFLTIIK